MNPSDTKQKVVTATELADMVALLMISCTDNKSWHEARRLLSDFYAQNPSAASRLNN